MKLTKKELEIMAVLWNRKFPMTATEIIEASINRTWKENSIYIVSVKPTRTSLVAKFNPQGFMQILR